MNIVLVHAVKLTPDGCQSLTVAAPGREELNEPGLRAQHLLLFRIGVHHKVREGAVV